MLRVCLSTEVLVCCPSPPPAPMKPVAECPSGSVRGLKQGEVNYNTEKDEDAGSERMLSSEK